MSEIKYFKNTQYVSLEPDKMPDGVCGYFCKGYVIEGDDIYLISGNAHIKHNINDLKECYRTNIIQLIDSIEEKTL